MNWLNKHPIAHRGLHYDDIYENTRESFQAAIKQNYAIECDVVLTKDHEVAVFHDENLKRLCQINTEISDITMNELRKQKIHNSNCNIISLDEMLHIVSERVPIIIEIKGDYTPFIEERIQEIIRSYKGPIALKSFSLRSIKWIIEFLPFIFKGLIVDKYTNNSEIIFDIDLDFISCDINHVDSNLIIKARKNGLSIITWTIDNVEKKDKANLFADNIIFEKITP